MSSSGAFVVKIECPAGETSCTGTITLRTLHAVSAGSSGGKGKSKPAVLTLAAGSFTVAGGQTKAVTLHLSATARKLLARDHTLSARATIVAHNPAGATHTAADERDAARAEAQARQRLTARHARKPPQLIN